MIIASVRVIKTAFSEATLSKKAAHFCFETSN